MDWILELYIGQNLSRKFKLDIPEIKIGRAKGNHINLPHGAVSRHHAFLTLARDYVVLEDLKSTNGTYYKEKKIERVYLREGDFFVIGPYAFYLKKSFFEDAQPISEISLDLGQDYKTDLIDKEVKERILQQFNGLEDTHIGTKKEEKF